MGGEAKVDEDIGRKAVRSVDKRGRFEEEGFVIDAVFTQVIHHLHALTSRYLCHDHGCQAKSSQAISNTPSELYLT